MNEAKKLLLERKAGSLKRIGGRLCLDFINTVGFRDGRDFVEEHFHDILDVLAWGNHAGLLSAGDAETAVARYMRQPDGGTDQFSRAFRLREAIHALTTARMRHEKPGAGLLDLLNRELADARFNRLLGESSGILQWTWRSGISPIDHILWPVTLSAAELLTEDDHVHLHECGGERCGWIFEDLSKNHSRRWCTMEDCGNVAKVRRYRQIHREHTSH